MNGPSPPENAVRNALIGLVVSCLGLLLSIGLCGMGFGAHASGAAAMLGLLLFLASAAGVGTFAVRLVLAILEPRNK